MDTELKSLDLPCNVDDFCKIQVKRYSSSAPYYCRTLTS